MLWRWTTSGRKSARTASIPRLADVDHSIRPTPRSRPATSGGGGSISISVGKWAAYSRWVLLGWAMPKKATRCPAAA